MSTAVASEQKAEARLNGFHRCDRCGSLAYVQVGMPGGGELLFCSHHYSRHEEALTDLGASVHDERWRLEEGSK